MAVMDTAGKFDVTMPLAKVWQDASGDLRFEGVASSTRLDRQQERMTARAIEKMAAHSGIDLLPSHGAGPLEELGTVEEAWVDNETFRVAGRLDRTNPHSQRLFAQVAGGRRYGLSVGGRVKKAFWKYDEGAGRQVRHIDDVDIDHVAVCRPEAAANPDTYLATLAKAADGMMDEPPVGEEATFARVGRVAMEAARAIWPFAKSGQEPQDDCSPGDDLRTLREEIAGALGEVREAVDALRKAEQAAQLPPPPPDEGGRSQALIGQEVGEKCDPWAGVV